MTQKMTTGFERVFRHLQIRDYSGPPIFREIFMHYIHFLNEDNTVQKSKLDKMIEKGFWMEAMNGERSIHGECEYTFPDGVTRRLVALPTDVNGNPVITAGPVIDRSKFYVP